MRSYYEVQASQREREAIRLHQERPGRDRRPGADRTVEDSLRGRRPAGGRTSGAELTGH